MPKSSILFNTWRTGRNLSQTEVAEVMGCTQSMVSRIESGEYSPSAEMLENLCTHYGVRPATLGFKIVRAVKVERVDV